MLEKSDTARRSYASGDPDSDPRLSRRRERLYYNCANVSGEALNFLLVPETNFQQGFPVLVPYLQRRTSLDGSSEIAWGEETSTAVRLARHFHQELLESLLQLLATRIPRVRHYT